MILLEKERKQLQQYLHMVSGMGFPDVEVMEKSGEVLAALGKLESNIGHTYNVIPKIYETSIKEQQTLTIPKAQKHPLIEKCNVINKEDLKSAFVTPIVVDFEVFGVLSILSYGNFDEPNEATNELYSYIIEEIVSFIGLLFSDRTDAYERVTSLNLFETMLRNMDEGAIVLNEQKEVQIVNRSAKKIFGIDRVIDQDRLDVSFTGDKINDLDELKIKLNEKEITVLGKIFEIPDNQKYHSVILFRDMQKLKSNIYELTTTINPVGTESIIGSSKQTRALKKEIVKVSKSSSTVLITGESGTGKEMVASAIWKNSDRKDKPFIAINCAAIPEALLESELFGYVKGAFTGADPKGRMGKFELANNGVIFLDEIGDMPMFLQSKLLRVIQERKLTRIGSNQLLSLDVRIIAATNQDLKARIKQNTFREDLYYRLNVIPIEIQPLRERTDDLKDLLFHFIQIYGNRFSKNFKELNDDVLQILLEYPWPGNVRELENACEYMVNMMERGVINKEMLPKTIYDPFEEKIAFSNIVPLQQLEQSEILKALQLYGNNTQGKELAAKALGIGIATLYRKLKDLPEQVEI